MKTIKLSEERMLSILFNHMYPNGNIRFLLKHVNGVGLLIYGRGVQISTDLPDDHWAFTQSLPPVTPSEQARATADRTCCPTRVNQYHTPTCLRSWPTAATRSAEDVTCPDCNNTGELVDFHVRKPCPRGCKP